MKGNHFIDYYEILQVSSNADPETIERVFRLLAKRYHPDNTLTGDSERFSMITEAFRVLSNPEKRAAYDARYESGRREQWKQFMEAPTSGADADRKIQVSVLSMLYGTRRKNPSDPEMGIFELEKFSETAEGQLEFHLWYLKGKGWIQRTESGKYAITVEGVDAVSENNRTLRMDRLLTAGDLHDAKDASDAPDNGKGVPFLNGWTTLNVGVAAR